MNLITDRTLLDVEEIKALTEAIKAGTATEAQVQQYLNADNKGAYTYRDLNRVEEAVLYVAERLKENGYLVDIPVTRSWMTADKPNAKDFERYLSNVALIRNAIPVWANTPDAPTDMNGFDINKANALERILADVDRILNNIRDSWFYLGDLYLAEV